MYIHIHINAVGNTCPNVKQSNTKLLCISVRGITGSGAKAEASSNGFYVDDTVPEFDTDIMEGDFYFDVGQGESTPVKYQKSNDTIKCVWKCDDEESGIVVSIHLNIHSILCKGMWH